MTENDISSIKTSTCSIILKYRTGIENHGTFTRRKGIVIHRPHSLTPHSMYSVILRTFLTTRWAGWGKNNANACAMSMRTNVFMTSC